MTFKRNKIKGISFHHQSNRKSIKKKYKLQDFFNIDELYLQVKRETPEKLTSLDIRRLLGDHGRNEINSQISRCIDFATKWTGILKVIEKCFPDKYFLNPDYLTQITQEGIQITALESEIEIYLLIKKLIWLWRHNLNMIEMTAQAQSFILTPFNK